MNVDILQLISSLGFPIVACIFVAVYTTKQTDNYRADIKEIQAAHKEEIKSLETSLNNNTLVLQKLCDRLDQEEKERSA